MIQINCAIWNPGYIWLLNTFVEGSLPADYEQKCDMHF